MGSRSRSIEKDVPELRDLHLIKKFQAVLDEFIHSIISNGYVEDAVEILESVLKVWGSRSYCKNYVCRQNES